LCACARRREEVGVWDAQVGEAGVRPVGGFVAAEFGVGENGVCGRWVGGDVSAGEEEDENFGGWVCLQRLGLRGCIDFTTDETC
jgi:hypothetical protein